MGRPGAFAGIAGLLGQSQSISRRLLERGRGCLYRILWRVMWDCEADVTARGTAICADGGVRASSGEGGCGGVVSSL